MKSFGLFLRCERYGLLDYLVYPRMISSCEVGGALLYVLSDLMKTCSAFSTCQLLQDMAMDQVLSWFAIA